MENLQNMDIDSEAEGYEAEGYETEGYEADMDCDMNTEGKWDSDVDQEGHWDSCSYDSLEIAMMYLDI